MKESFNLCKGWVLNSGIQKENSGFYAWHNLEENNFSYLYSEITGYGISTLIFFHNIERDKIFIEKARQGAKWLIDEAMDARGGFKTRKYDNNKKNAYSFERGSIYAFDNGMILCGILNLWETTKDALYLEAAKKCGNFLIEKMKHPNGGFFAYYIPAKEEACDETSKWSNQTGSFHAKTALGLIKLGKITGERRYIREAEGICEKSISFYKNGRFITNRDDNSTHLHPHCYTIEGLIYAGYRLNRKDFLDYAVKATEWTLELQRPDGGLPFMVYDDGDIAEYQRTDVLAQALRAGSLFCSMGLMGKVYLDKLGKLADRLVQFQYTGDGSQKGGFYFGYDFDGKKINHLNTWCSMFAAQALNFYDNENNLPNERKIEYLV